MQSKIGKIKLWLCQPYFRGIFILIPDLKNLQKYKKLDKHVGPNNSSKKLLDIFFKSAQ